MAGIDLKLVEEVAGLLYVRALKILPPDVKAALAAARERERYRQAREILGVMLKNIEVAETRGLMVCQDTGLPIYKVRIGAEARVDGAGLESAIRRGVERVTRDHPLRSSVCHPLSRKNPQTNTGERIPVVEFDFLPEGDHLEIRMMPKGSGSENMSFLKMLTPAAGIAGVKKFVLDAVVGAGGNPCPPTVVGVGLGGTADLCMRLAKEATFRPIGTPHPEAEVAALERELLAAINQTGIGPMGLGGDTTVLAVQIEIAHTHITQNPVAVNIQCWRGERASARIFPDGRVEYGS